MESNAKVSLRKKVCCSIIISISALLLIFVFCGRFFDSPLRNVANFFVGSFGMSFYGFMIAAIAIASFSLAGKKINIPPKYAVHFVLLFIEIVLLVHMYSTIFLFNSVQGDYLSYIGYVYNYYDWVPTFGGVVFGSVMFALQSVLKIYGASILLFALLAWSVVVVGDFFYSYSTGKLSLSRVTKREESVTEPSEKIAESVETEDERSRAMKILFPEQNGLNPRESENKEVFDVAPQSELDSEKSTSTKSSREEAVDILFNGRPLKEVKKEDDDEIILSKYNNKRDEMAGNSGFFDSPSKAESADDEALPWHNTDASQIKGESSSATEQSAKTQNKSKPSVKSDSLGGEWIIPAEEPKEGNKDNYMAETTSKNEVDAVDVFVDDNSSGESNFSSVIDEEPNFEKQNEDVNEEIIGSLQNGEESDLSKHVDVETSLEKEVTSEPEQEIPYDENELVPVEQGKAVQGGIQMGFDFQPQKDVKEAEKAVHHYPNYVVPPFDLLEEAVAVEDTEQEYREHAAQAIVKKLAIFGIIVESAGQVVGPSVTRYMFKVTSEKTRMTDFKQYSADIKACLEATNDIIIQAPIPGTNMVGIEVANKVTKTVKLRNLLESKEFQESKAKLAFIIGQEITGEILVGDLSKLPHLLVAGTTGSGKSVFLDSMIISLMYKYGPEYLRFIMVDPKLVELSRFNGIPHMLTSETIITANDALASMDYLISEMEARYQLFKQNGVVNIVGYNAKINPKITQRLPYLILVVDELSDLMSVCQKQFEAKLLKLAQKSRAAGIHMVLATQRPDVKTITGTIKTNFSCRVALKVAAPQDSMTILSTGGAEKLLGKGDMLYLGEGQASATRAQGTFVNDDEIAAFVNYVKESNEIYFDDNIAKQIFSSEQESSDEEPKEGKADAQEEKLDPYCKKALRFWLEVQKGRASIASIQRSLKIGFNRAGRIMDSLQRLGYVEETLSSETSTRPLRVLVTLDQLDTLFPDMEG